MPATKVYTEETNGLSHKWIADRVFMNHPYSDSKTWVPYAVSQYELGYAKELILLIKLDYQQNGGSQFHSILACCQQET